jgi:hypothetical protein
MTASSDDGEAIRTEQLLWVRNDYGGHALARRTLPWRLKNLPHGTPDDANAQQSDAARFLLGSLDEKALLSSGA